MVAFREEMILVTGRLRRKEARRARNILWYSLWHSPVLKGTQTVHFETLWNNVSIKNIPIFHAKPRSALLVLIAVFRCIRRTHGGGCGPPQHCRKSPQHHPPGKLKHPPGACDTTITTALLGHKLLGRPPLVRGGRRDWKTVALVSMGLSPNSFMF